MDKIIGSILLIAGTCIGAGMISLPVVIGVYGLLPSLLILSIVCFINIVIAFVLVETIVKFESDSNLVTVTGFTLGKTHQKIIWLSCLFFFYSILTAYTSDLQELWFYLIQDNFNIHIPSWLITSFLILLIAVLVHLGTRFNDYINRILVVILIVSFVGLLFNTINNINFDNFNLGYKSPLSALPIVYTSFGYLIIIPYLRTYLDSNIKQMKIAIIIGSIIPLFIYFVWILLVLGLIPINGENSLNSIMELGEPGAGIILAITNITHNNNLSFIFKLFTFACITSSYIGVGLALYNFLADGLHMNPNFNSSEYSKALLAVYAFLPLLILNLFVKKIVILFLGLAGMFSVITSGLYPAMMAWAARKKYPNTSVEIKGGKVLLVLIFLFSGLVLLVGLWNLIL